MTHDELIGCMFDFVYADETYRIEVLDEASLRWIRTLGDPAGTSDVEEYVWSAIDDRRWMITWIEATGLGLSSVVDLGDGTLLTHANDGRDVFVNAGTVTAVTS